MYLHAPQSFGASYQVMPQACPLPEPPRVCPAGQESYLAGSYSMGGCGIQKTYACRTAYTPNGSTCGGNARPPRSPCSPQSTCYYEDVCSPLSDGTGVCRSTASVPKDYAYRLANRQCGTTKPQFMKSYPLTGNYMYGTCKTGYVKGSTFMPHPNMYACFDPKEIAWNKANGIVS